MNTGDRAHSYAAALFEAAFERLIQPLEATAQVLAKQPALLERLGAGVRVGDEVLAVEREYERYVIDFHVYACTLSSTQLERRRVRDFRWVSLAELSDYEFPPADQESLDLLLNG